jgi:hypothetical protein
VPPGLFPRYGVSAGRLVKELGLQLVMLVWGRTVGRTFGRCRMSSHGDVPCWFHQIDPPIKDKEERSPHIDQDESFCFENFASIRSSVWI